jgi:cell wall-associated NlpC family hydrolase
VATDNPMTLAVRLGSLALVSGLVSGTIDRATPPFAEAQPSVDSIELHLNPQDLQPGDLVFRSGVGWLGQTVNRMDGDSIYSHVGLVVEVDQQLQVVHASPAANPGDAGQVVVDTPPEFLQRDQATAVAVYRLKAPAEQSGELAAAIALQYAVDQVPFDAQFDLTDASQLYCTELVWRAYQGIGIDLVQGQFTQVSFLGQSQPYLLPSALVNSPKLEPVYESSPQL